MKAKTSLILAAIISLVLVRSVDAQDLGPQFKKFKEGIYVVKQYNILRPFVTIPDILAAVKMMKGLNPEFVIPGHGIPGTVKIFEDTEQYYAVLLDRVGKMAREGKSLDQIKKELKMPEYDDWATKERVPSNIEAAYKVVKSN